MALGPLAAIVVYLFAARPEQTMWDLNLLILFGGIRTVLCIVFGAVGGACFWLISRPDRRER